MGFPQAEAPLVVFPVLQVLGAKSTCLPFPVPALGSSSLSMPQVTLVSLTALWVEEYVFVVVTVF